MFKLIMFFLVLLLNGCTIGPHMSVSLRRGIELCKNIIKYDSWLIGRKYCLRQLNYDHIHYSEYLGSCQSVLNRYKTSWEILDWKIIAKAKANNEPLPENFKTTEDIFATYPNPCQDSATFRKQLKEYEVQQKTKKI